MKPKLFHKEKQFVKERPNGFYYNWRERHLDLQQLMKEHFTQSITNDVIPSTKKLTK